MEQVKIRRLTHIRNEFVTYQVLCHSGIKVAGGFTFNWLPEVTTRNQRRTVKRMLARINADPAAWVVERQDHLGTQSVWYVDPVDGAMLMLNLKALTGS